MAAGLCERLAPRLTDLPLLIVGSFQAPWWVPGAPFSSSGASCRPQWCKYHSFHACGSCFCGHGGGVHGNGWETMGSHEAFTLSSCHSEVVGILISSGVLSDVKLEYFTATREVGK